MFQKLFHLKENGTDVKTEVIGGITTFMAMAYILAVNPSILSQSGMDSQAVLIATALAAFVGTLCMAFMANYPFALAPGLGLNAYFAYSWGGQIYNQTLVDKVENAQLNYNVDKRAYYDAWMKEGDNVQFKSIGAWNKPTQATSRFVQKLNEFDFSALSIGYDFYRFGFVEKCGLERLQLQFNMNDIGKISSVQIERGTSYPFARYCSFTLNVNF